MTLRRPRRFWTYLSTTAVILVFAVCLVFASVRLLGIERDMAHDIGEDIVFAMGQGEYEAVRFAYAVSRRTADADALPDDELQRRFNVLLSRLESLSHQQPLRYLIQFGSAARFKDGMAALGELEGEVLSLRAGERGKERRVLAIVEPMSELLRDATVKTMIAERERALGLRDSRQRTMLEVLGYVIGIMASGAILAFSLVRGNREIARTESSLQREREVSQLYRAFVSMVSHQFRTPLAIIDSSAQRLIRQKGGLGREEILARAGKIRAAIGRLTTLMESTLNAARLDAGEIDLKPSDCDLGDLVLAACQRQRELAPTREINVDVERLPGTVRCDPTLMEQVVSNLLSNALKYSADDRPVDVTGWADRDGTLRLAVRDRGVGIPAEDLPRLFERFFRARTASGIAGTGIGLSFARYIAHLHGGDIAAESVEGEGSTFTMILPHESFAAEGRRADGI
jgi:signal transduction histidine kinase